MQLKLLITEHFLTTLAAGHAFLLGLTGLRRRKLLLLLLFDNLVTESVKLDLFFVVLLLVNTLTRALALDPVVA